MSDRGRAIAYPVRVDAVHRAGVCIVICRHRDWLTGCELLNRRELPPPDEFAAKDIFRRSGAFAWTEGRFIDRTEQHILGAVEACRPIGE
jgi:hypothetical protein